MCSVLCSMNVQNEVVPFLPFTIKFPEYEVWLLCLILVERFKLAQLYKVTVEININLHYYSLNCEIVIYYCYFNYYCYYYYMFLIYGMSKGTNTGNFIRHLASSRLDPLLSSKFTLILHGVALTRCTDLFVEKKKQAQTQK